MRPLLLNLDSDEANDDYKELRSFDEVKSANRTPRKTPRDMMQKTDEKKKG